MNCPSPQMASPTLIAAPPTVIPQLTEPHSAPHPRQAPVQGKCDPSYSTFCPAELS